MDNRTAEASITKDNVVELRQYTLYGNRRDELIELFEREFIEPQNDAGARVIGTFRDLDDPDRFVWMRGFDNMDARRNALTTFYSGPVWHAYRKAANETMLDSDNALLLRPIGEGLATSVDNSTAGIWTLTTYDLARTQPADFAECFTKRLEPHLISLGATPAATLTTETSPNSFVQLPVREDQNVFVWLGRWQSEIALAEFERRFAISSGWRDAYPTSILPALARKPERLRLVPTSRSPLR